MSALVSVNNGLDLRSELSNEDLEYHWEALVHAMDDDTYHEALSTSGNQTKAQLLENYLDLAKYDLVIG